ncbi:MAG: hypothetical protein NC311_01965 [Muribaculaceae bacterium]|nr:hypothetical protein [Muribaculaceae bacterium]
MKKILIAFALLVVCGNSHADFTVTDTNWVAFTSDAVEQAINEYVNPRYQQSAADTYQEQMDAETGKISVAGIYRVCVAANFDLKQDDGFRLCRNMLNKMMTLSGFGTGSSTQQNCITKMNGVWTKSSDGKTYQCVGRDGSLLVYKKSCDDAGGQCIKDFADLQTQTAIGRQFINQWGLQKNIRLTCHSDVETRRGITSPLGQDYIRCSAGGNAYEFEFDDLNQDVDDTAALSQAKAACKLMGGTETTGVLPEQYLYCDNIDKEQCITIRNIAGNYTEMYYDEICRIARYAQKTSRLELSHIKGVDSYAFRNVQIRSDLAVPLVESYLHYLFPGVARSGISCDSNIRHFEDTTDLSGLISDDVLRCHVSGEGSVDFVFDDLAESMDYEITSGRSGIECMINGGRYKGKKCSMLTRQQCESISSQITGGTKWNANDGYCELNNVSMYYTISNTAITIGSAVLAGVVTYASGGSAAVVIAAVGADVGFSIGFELASEWVENNPHHQATKFLKQAVPCKNTQCAKSIITEYFNTLQATFDGLDDPDTINAVFNHIDRLSDMLSDNEFESAMNVSTVNIETKTASIVMPMMLAVGLVVDPQSVLTKLATRAPRLAAKLGKWRMMTFSKKYLPIMDAVDSSTLGGQTYVRMYVGNKSNTEITEIIRTLRENGMYVSSGTTQAGRRFLGFSDKNMFSAWERQSGNWLRNGASHGSQISNILARDFVSLRGTSVSRGRYSSSQAQQMVAELQNNGYIAIRQGTRGGANSEEYVIVAVHQSKIADLGSDVSYNGQNLVKTNMDNLYRATNANSYTGITLMNSGDVIARLGEVGQIGGRPVALVGLTNTRTGAHVAVPFYVSTGTAGKTTVPTGMWEFFGGYGGVGMSNPNWFQKGTLEDIIKHYNSPYLQQIANALDGSLGDLRDTEYVLETIGRQSAGGRGIVGTAANSPLPDWNGQQAYINQLMGGAHGNTIYETVAKVHRLMGWQNTL